MKALLKKIDCEIERNSSELYPMAASFIIDAEPLGSDTKLLLNFSDFILREVQKILVTRVEITLSTETECLINTVWGFMKRSEPS